MSVFLQAVTDRVSTRKGKWATLVIWLILTGLLGTFAPNAKEYEVSSIDSLPDDAPSVIAQNKLDEYFEGNDGIPAILVFQSSDELQLEDLTAFIHEIEQADINGLKEVIPLAALPLQAIDSFFSEDRTTALYSACRGPARPN